MRILTGDETGLIKQILIENKRIQRWGTQSRENSVERMVWAGPSRIEENEVAVAMRNGCVHIWDVDKTEIVKTFTGLEECPRGLGIIRENDERSVVVCGENGGVNIYKWDENESSSSFNVKGPISHMRLCPSNNKVIAVGGRENDIALYDIETQDSVFQGRNVPHDFLNLRVPVWVADMQFLSKEDGFKLAVVTGHHHIRIYDTRAQRRPIQSIELGDRPFTSCCVTPDEMTLIAGDTVGRVSRVDLRTLRLNGVFKGNTGSIRDITVHPTMNVVATVGLDRIMRVFDVETRQQLHRVYLRQRLNCVLFSSEEKVQCFAKEEEEEEEEVEKSGEESENEEVEDEEPEENNEQSDSDDSILHDDDLEVASDEESEENNIHSESDDSILHDDDDLEVASDEELEEE